MAGSKATINYPHTYIWLFKSFSLEPIEEVPNLLKSTTLADTRPE